MNEHKKNINDIVVLGDSLAKGIIFNKEKMRYSFYKQGFIKQITKKLIPTVHDFSKFGTTTTYGNQILAEKISEINPDLIFIEYGGNDCDFNWDAIANDPYKLHLPNTSIAQFESNLKSMINTLNAKNIVPVLMDLPPLNAEAYFKWFSKEDDKRAKTILCWLKDASKIYWWQEMYSFTISTVARETKTRIVNVRNAFLQQNDYKEFICEDGIHPNEKGQNLMAISLDNYIKTHASYLIKA